MYPHVTNPSPTESLTPSKLDILPLIYFDLILPIWEEHVSRNVIQITERNRGIVVPFGTVHVAWFTVALLVWVLENDLLASHHALRTGGDAMRAVLQAGTFQTLVGSLLGSKPMTSEKQSQTSDSAASRGSRSHTGPVQVSLPVWALHSEWHGIHSPDAVANSRLSL